jgi:hypothetical protein
MVKMPMYTPDEVSPAGVPAPEPRSPEVVIRSGILSALGRPPGLYRVAVSRLWQDHYRVNVLTGSDATSVRIPHSYFVRTGVGGDVVSTAPPVTRLYE